MRDNGDPGRLAGVEVASSSQKKDRGTLEMGLIGLTSGLDVRLESNGSFFLDNEVDD